MELHEETAALLPECTELRQKLHRIPELGFEEHETQSFILDYLRALAPDELTPIAGTGVKAVWYAPEPESTLAFRADMDALPTAEETLAPYASAHEGKMHACGHDGHMTMLLLLARHISAHRKELRHNAVLLFQPAEEGGCGASRMIAEGALCAPKVDKIYGLHLWPDVPKGKIGIRWGVQMAQSCDLDITCLGLSAHGASPQKGVDAVVASAALIVMLQSAITRDLDPHQDALLTIGRIDGGSARNIIADRVEMNATLRTLSADTYDQLLSRIGAMARGVAYATGAEFEVKERMRYPSVDNPRALVEEMYTHIDMADVVLVEPAMAAEDFACYQREVPGIFIFVGASGGKNSEPLHNCRFDFDEDALLVGAELYGRLLEIW